MTYDDVAVGAELPEFVLDVTTSVIVAGAVASRDFMPVHHDRDYAQRAGSKDIFMNILTTNGYVGRYVTDWAGPEARITRQAIRLGVPNYPGDTMRMTGRVTAKDGGVVTVEVTGSNASGDHVSGAVELRFE
jgi:acyl dehydratase